MNKKVALLWNILVCATAIAGSCVSAIQFAVAVRFAELGKAVLFFALASICVETSVFSIAHLIKKRK